MTPAHVQQILGDRAIDTVNRFRGFGPLFIAMTSFSLIMAALASEYFGGEPPCRLCYIQRFPHVVTGLFAIMAWQLRKDDVLLLFLLALCVISGWFGTLLSVYHTGGELGLWDLSSACEVKIAASAAANMAQYISAESSVICDRSAWRLFQIPMAGYNIVASFGLSLLTIAWMLALWPSISLGKNWR